MPVTSRVTSCHTSRESTALSVAAVASCVSREEPQPFRARCFARHRCTRSSLRQCCSRRYERSARDGLQFRKCVPSSPCDPLAVKTTTTLSLVGAEDGYAESATMHYVKLPLSVQMALIVDALRCKSPRYRILVNADSLSVSARHGATRSCLQESMVRI